MNFVQSDGGREWTSILSVGGFYLMVSITALVKELFVAHQFGTSDVMDAFLIALLLPSLGMNILSGAFQGAFIPEYIHMRERQGAAEATKLFSNIVCLYLCLLIALTIFLLLTAPLFLPMLGSHFDPEELALSRSLFFILIPILTLTGLVKAWGSFFNAGEHFRLPSISPIVTHFTTIFLLIGLGSLLGIYALAFGTLVGIILEFGIFLYVMRLHNYPILPKFHAVDSATRKIIPQYMHMIVGSLLMGSTAFIDQAMATMLGPGSVSALGYGGKGVLFIVGLASMGLSTVMLPHFSKQVAMEQWENVKQTLVAYSRRILLATLPVTFVLIYFSEAIIRVIFERGAFSSADTILVGKVQAFYLPQIPFYILGILGVRLLSALGKNQMLMGIGAINLVVNIIGNYVFMQYWGLAGIALSTSLVYALSMCQIIGVVKIEIRNRIELSGK